MHLQISVKIKAAILCSLIFICSQIIVFTTTSAVQETPPATTRQKLDGISKEEKKVLEDLFNLTQEVMIAEKEEAALSLEIKAIEKEITDCEEIIKNEVTSYANKKEGLKKVLKTYQRMGPGTYLEIILDSDSLSSFIQRINTLRDLTRNTGEMLKELEASKLKLARERNNLNEKLAAVVVKERLANEYLARKQQLKQKQEEYLSSLKGEREFYQEHLNNIHKMIEDLKPFLSNAAYEFANIVKSGQLQPEDFKISFSLLDIKGSIEEKVLNNIVAKQPGFPKMAFAFHPGKAEVSFPDKNLVISGNFIIEDGHIMKFKAEEGSFHGLPLEAGYIKELFGESGLAIDFEAIIGKIIISSVSTREGFIEITVKLGSF